MPQQKTESKTIEVEPVSDEGQKMPITITEALAEIKTICKRIEKKRDSIMPYIARQDGLKDPLASAGGSDKFIASERQAMTDLGKRLIALRGGIQKANDETMLNINGVERSIADWLTWRRDVAPTEKMVLATLRSAAQNARAQAQKQGVTVIPAGATATQPADFIINIDEAVLSKEIEDMEDTLGQLDGQLSLKNATVMIKE